MALALATWATVTWAMVMVVAVVEDMAVVVVVAVVDAAVTVDGENLVLDAAAQIAVEDSNVPILVVDVDVAAAQTSTSLLHLVPVSTTLVVSAAPRSHQKENANGRATGRAVVNVLHLSSSSNH